MSKLIIRIVALVLLAGLASVSQSEGRSVSGVVTDKRGNALRKAVVQLENEHDQTVRSFVTGNDGRYHFSGLSSDIDYTLRAHYRLDWSKSRNLSEFNSSTHPQVDLVIPIE